MENAQAKWDGNMEFIIIVFESEVSLLSFLFNKGDRGEELTFMALGGLAPSGIYVLESKNYSRWIFGKVRFKEWTSVIYKQKISTSIPSAKNANMLNTSRNF